MSDRIIATAHLVCLPRDCEMLLIPSWFRDKARSLSEGDPLRRTGDEVVKYKIAIYHKVSPKEPPGRGRESRVRNKSRSGLPEHLLFNGRLPVLW